MSLFRRIRILSNQNIKINIKCTSSIYHSLSRIDEKPSIFRSIERLIDAFLTCRNYFCLENFIFMLKVFIKESPTVGIFNALYLLLKTMLTGEHPRSISWRKYYNE